MKASTILGRFLSLLDVALLLLGLFMIVLALEQIQRPQSDSSQPAGLAEAADVGLIFVFAGSVGELRGRCFLLNTAGKISQEIRTDTDADIRQIVDARRRRNPIVILLFRKGDWDAVWTDERIKRLENTWGLPLVRLYDSPLPLDDQEH